MRMLCLLSGNDNTEYVQHFIEQLMVQGVHVDTTSNDLLINEDSLSSYPAIALLGGDVSQWEQHQKNAFERFIQAGGGCILKYNADSVVNWPWFNGLLEKITVAENNRQPTTVYDGGRFSFFNAANEQSLFSDEHTLQHAIQFACGSFLLPDYSNATSIKIPDERRFSKRQLAANLNRPVQMTILPSGDILIAEHEGDILYVNPEDNTVSTAMHLDVYHIYSDKDRSGDTEMGLLGLHRDPDFEKNHWVYVYYSALDKSVDRLSRFTLEGKKLLPASERVILEVPTERYYPMAHTGGGMAFDAAKNLYLSTGDNTNPFFLWDTITGRDHPYNVNGFAPIDDRPLYKHSDDRRAAGNSNDLRGKILRIRINEDGSYTIPDGNLFAKNDPKAKPEIYTMGNRNPYRIAVDQHTGFLYWGEVGPDAYHDSLETRGPKGYDEINQAKRAGNFGYPYFVANNYPYRAYDYATGVSGPPFDSHHVINDSRNNTGLRELPDAQPAMIWYPYDKSPYFPVLGQGGRSAMAGPVYYTGDYPAKERLPEYYNGKLFIYDWARSWIMAVTMNKDGTLQYIEPFLPSLKFASPVDMKAGANGRLYVLEYGSGWGVNPDAALFVIDYRAGNMLPVADLTVSSKNGALPLKQKFSARASYDPDGKITQYKWHIGNDTTITTRQPELEYSFASPGIYAVGLTVFDDKGDSVQSPLQHIIAGNSAPEIKINVKDDPAYYFSGTGIAYHIDVSDKEDGTVSSGGIDTKNLRVKIAYREGGDRIIMDSQSGTADADNGEVLMLSLDCKSCHKKEENSLGLLSPGLLNAMRQGPTRLLTSRKK
ncbi:MAG: PQQ-dependent sugar dehydrogenase [Agriterribacter sp.]